MENQLSVLNSTELCGHNFTVYGTPENPMFLAKDVATIIEYDLSSVNKLVNLVDDDEKVRNILPTLGGNRQVWFLTEDGLYEVLMQSRKPIAKQFKKGVKRILHEVRTQGGYIAGGVNESEEEIMSKAYIIAKRTLERREERLRELEHENEMKSETIALQAKEAEKAAPKVNYYDATLQSVNTMTATQIAKEMGMDANKLNNKLKEVGILYKQSGQWLLHAPYSGWGLHATRTQTYTRSDGSVGTSTYTVWHQKGRRLIHALKDCDWDLKKAVRTIKGEAA